MDFVRPALLVVHLLGFAALLGGLLAQARVAAPSVTPLVRDGAGTAVVAGLVLAGVIVQQDDPDGDWWTKVAVKVAVGLVLLALVTGGLRRERISRAWWATMLVLTLADLGVAVFWHPARGTY